MSDVRRLNLEEATKREVSLVSIDKYKLGPDGLQTLENNLPLLMKQDYWSPEYQAWEPLIKTYLTSGVNSELAQEWLPRMSAKVRQLGPKRGTFSDIFGAVQYMNRVPSVEAFAGFSWQQVLEFVNTIPKYIDNQKIILDYLFSKANYSELISAVVAEAGKCPYGDNFVEAIYLYRHCMLFENPTPSTIIEILRQQLAVWIDRFELVFESAASILPDRSGIYGWYTREVKSLIVKTWSTALDISQTRSIITRDDVMSMPIWLSEQMTNYLRWLPCVVTVPVDGQFAFDAIEYAFRPEANLADPNMIYAFCIPKDYVKSLFSTLSEFYWVVMEGKFVPYLISRVEAAYAMGKQGLDMTPDEYRLDLLRRGFPAEGL